MKRCNHCNTVLDDETNFCVNCGSSDLTFTSTQPNMNNPQIPAPADIPQPANTVPSGNGNVVAGIVGAFLFALIGGALYFVVYQMGYVASICGLATFVLASFGYDLFSRSKHSTIGMITAAIAFIATIYAAEYLCISFEIFQVYKDIGITFFDAVRATSEFLKDEELMRAFIGDLVFAYVFGIVAVIGNIVSAVKAKKQAQ